MNWPLGINSEMDNHAKERGLGHWCCTDPMGNGTWIRQDGEILRPHFRTGGYPVELREFDKENPMQKCVFGNINFKEGDVIELPGEGFIQWFTEEEAIPLRVLRKLRQEQIQRIIAFTKENTHDNRNRNDDS